MKCRRHASIDCLTARALTLLDRMTWRKPRSTSDYMPLTINSSLHFRTPWGLSNVLQSLIAAALLVPAVTALAEDPRQHRFIYNNDGSNVFIYDDAPMTPEDVYPYVDEVASTQVTTFFICPNWGMPLMYPSHVTEMLGSTLDEAGWKAVKEAAAEPGQRPRGIVNLHSLVDAGHDPIGLIVQRAHEKGLEVFVTFRINEIHDVQNPDSLIVTSFWREHPEWRVGRLGDEISPLFKEIIGGRADHQVHPIVASWFPGALNFAVPEVREFLRAELQECCERYPIDGLDLDFQRFPIYFPQDKGPEHVKTMTSFVRDVREMTQEVGNQHGRPLQLSARVLARPEQNIAIGLDPFSWAQEGLLDFLVVSHYLRNDYPLPIAEFRDRLPETFPLYGSVEFEKDPDSYRKIARRLWDDGADGILLFNFFASRESGKEPPLELLNELGKIQTIRETKE